MYFLFKNNVVYLGSRIKPFKNRALRVIIKIQKQA